MYKVPCLLYHHIKVIPSYPLHFHMWKVTCLVSHPLCYTVLSQSPVWYTYLSKQKLHILLCKWQKKNTYLSLLFSPSTSASLSHGFNKTSAVCWQKVCLEKIREQLSQVKIFLWSPLTTKSPQAQLFVWRWKSYFWTMQHFYI